MRTAGSLDLSMQLRALSLFTLAATLIKKLERRKVPDFNAPSASMISLSVSSGKKNMENELGVFQMS